MRLSIKSMAVAGGLLWGSGILFVGLINLVRPGYGMDFLKMMTSVYPWFHSSHTIGNVVIGTIDGVIDGAVAGCLFGWLYNAIAGLSAKTHSLEERHI